MATRGFFAVLFDTSLTEFLTSRIIRFLYTLWLVGALLFGGAIVVVGIASRDVDPFAALLGGPLVALLLILLGRLWAEGAITLFRVAEHTGELVALARRVAAPPSAPGTQGRPLA